MTTSSGNSSGTTTTTTYTATRSTHHLQNSSSEEDLQQMMDERKRKRMQSNRESARRSRMRKQKHLDDLTAKVALLGSENTQILNTLQITTQHCLNVEGENSVLRAQMAELASRLDSLNEILNHMSSSSNATGSGGGGCDGGDCECGDGDGGGAAGEMVVGVDGFMGNHWNLGYVNQPIMASASGLWCSSF